jgi:hypothetical protein
LTKGAFGRSRTGRDAPPGQPRPGDKHLLGTGVAKGCPAPWGRE